MPEGEPSVKTQPGTWVLQADAAARAGCSLSAIRKWRRSGAVASRTATNAAGQERVEVRLEDVIARVGPPVGPAARGSTAADEGMPPPGTVIVAIADLEALFERIADAERRVDAAETRLEAAEDEARFVFGRLAELRQQLESERARRAAPSPSPPVPQPAPRPTPRAAARVPSPLSMATQRARRSPDLRSLGTELHRLYTELHMSRSGADNSPSSVRRRQRALSAYDTALLAACEALGVSDGRSRGQPLTAETRRSLSRALADAGLDVRFPPQPSRTGTAASGE